MAQAAAATVLLVILAGLHPHHANCVLGECIVLAPQPPLEAVCTPAVQVLQYKELQVNLFALPAIPVLMEQSPILYVPLEHTVLLVQQRVLHVLLEHIAVPLVLPRPQHALHAQLEHIALVLLQLHPQHVRLVLLENTALLPVFPH